MKELTFRQKQVLETIRKHIQSAGYPPTVREIGARLGLKSSCTVQKHIEALIRKGLLVRHGSKSRTIELVDAGPKPIRMGELINVPLVGQVAAGTPILAEENIENYFPVSRDLVRSEDVFMLRVKGDSMIEAGVFDGDYVVIRQQQTADNGDMVVAMTEDGEATVKYFYRDDGRIRLQPANAAMEPMILQDVTVLGKVDAVFRQIG